MSDTTTITSLTGTVAFKDMNGRYMSVTDTNGLVFQDSVIDQTALFAVQNNGGDQYSLIGNNGQFVNMYYVSDVKCEGATGGLSVGLSHQPQDKVCLTISGYDGQDGKTYYLSNQPGNPGYNGSLAVKETEDQTCAFTLESIPKPNVTGTITLRNLHGCYLKVTSTDGLICNSKDLDDNAKFSVKYDGAKLALIGHNGKYVNMYYVSDVKCAGPGGGLLVGLEYYHDVSVLFTISGYDGQDGATYFMSSDPGNPAYNGSVAVKTVADDTCRFMVDSYANVSGTIKLKDSTGAYLHVTDSNGLAFEVGAVDDTCRFTVKRLGDKIGLVDYAGRYINMYGISYVQCKGPPAIVPNSGGLAMGIEYINGGLVQLTISGYQGQGNKTAYLSNRVGEVSESLLVASDADDSCRFVVENY